MLHPLRSPFHQIGTEKGPLKENLFSAKIKPPRLSSIRNAAPFSPERRGKPFLPDQHQIGAHENLLVPTVPKNLPQTLRGGRGYRGPVFMN